MHFQSLLQVAALLATTCLAAPAPNTFDPETQTLNKRCGGFLAGIIGGCGGLANVGFELTAAATIPAGVCWLGGDAIGSVSAQTSVSADTWTKACTGVPAGYCNAANVKQEHAAKLFKCEPKDVEKVTVPAKQCGGSECSCWKPVSAPKCGGCSASGNYGGWWNWY